MLTTTVATIAPGDQIFTFLVPGDRVWALRSVIAVCSRDVGGAPDRSYSLVVSKGDLPVSRAGADDAGTEPGTCTITWCNCPPSSVDSGATGVVVAPHAPPTLEPGYTVVGTIENPAAGDEWTSAIAWYDFGSSA